MGSHTKASKELAKAIAPYGLAVEHRSTTCLVTTTEGKKISGYTMVNGEHSVSGAIRDLRRRGLVPVDEQVGTEKPRGSRPDHPRKTRTRKKSPAPVTRLPRDDERVPASRLAVKDGVRFGVYGPTRVADALSRVRGPGGEDIDPEQAARAAARLAAADRRASRVPVVTHRSYPVVPVKDDGPDLAPQAVAPECDSLSDAQSPVVPVRTFHELLPACEILKKTIDGLGSQQEIGALCGMGQGAVSALLSGRTRVTPRSAMRFEIGLGVEGLAEQLLMAQMREELRTMRYLAKAGEL